MPDRRDPWVLEAIRASLGIVPKKMPAAPVSDPLLRPDGSSASVFYGDRRPPAPKDGDYWATSTETYIRRGGQWSQVPHSALPSRLGGAQD